MHRLLRLLDRPGRAHTWGPVSATRPRRSRAGGGGGGGFSTSFITAAVVGAVVGGAYLSRSEPLGSPPPVPTGEGTFAFSADQPRSPGTPVTYDPCEPVRYVVNDAHAPAGAAQLLDDAVAEVSAATGLVFERAGATDALPFSGTASSGDSNPVVIAWTTPDDVPELEGRVAGSAGSTALTRDNLHAHYVTGGVALDGPDIAAVLHGPDGLTQARAIVLHELGHLVGLDHVDDPGELMHSDNVGTTAFGPGDREGLAALGSGRCA